MSEHHPFGDFDDFGERLEASLRHEPGPVPPEDDLRRGRRRLRARRAQTTIFSAVTVGAAVAAAVAVTPHLGKPTVSPAGPGDLSPAEIVAQCLSASDVSDSNLGKTPTRARVRQELGAATVMTSSTTRFETVATLRSGDGARFADCHLGDPDVRAYPTSLYVYPTSVRFPAHRVDGLPVYDPPAENDPQLSGTATTAQPQVWQPCHATAREESAEYYAQLAECDHFTLSWNDRRVPEVAKVKIVAPDGHVGWADVHEGYLSYAYVGRMTPSIAAQIRDYRVSGSGSWPAAREVVMYDARGRVLVDDKHPGDGQAGPVGRRTIDNYPSLAWWTDHRSAG